jgi:membrane protein implicated in regulation of membrane protease activity
MWIQRTPEEVQKWHQSSEREARGWGKIMGGIVWLVVPFLAAGGWLFFFRGGVLSPRATAGNFWMRCVIFAVLTIPFAYWVFRRESRKELEKLTRGTICPQCEETGEGNAGTTCACDASLVHQSTMKWKEETSDETAA